MNMKLISGLALAASLLLSGCGSEDTTCRIDVQTAMDKGDFNLAVSKLEGECSTAFGTAERNYNLAIAYMGKAGYGITDVLLSVIDSGDNTSGDAFATFASALTENKKENSSTYLKKSQEYFFKSIQTDANDTLSSLCANASTSTDNMLKNVCFYYGFNQTVTTVDTITYLTANIDAALESISNSNGSTPSDLQASLDALSWATDSNTTAVPVMASDVQINGKAYKHLDVNESGAIFYRLATSNAPDVNASTVLTYGYCDENGSTVNCQGIENSTGDINMSNAAASGCYACPVGIDSNSSTDVSEVLLDAINSGTDAIANLTDDPDIQQQIEEFKQDIGGVDGNITMEDILNYLNK